MGITIFLTVVLDLFFAIYDHLFYPGRAQGQYLQGDPDDSHDHTGCGIFGTVAVAAGSHPQWPCQQGVYALGGSEPLNWIAQYPFVIIIAATLLTSIAYGTTVFSSAVKSIPENQFRAARVDGAGEWEIVRNIILPNLRFHITFIALWETLGLLTNYVTIMLITNGGPGVQTEVWALSAYTRPSRTASTAMALPFRWC